MFSLRSSRPIKYVLFDMDGLLINSELVYTQGKCRKARAGAGGRMLTSSRIFLCTLTLIRCVSLASPSWFARFVATDKALEPWGRTMPWSIKAGLMGRPERDATDYLLRNVFADMPEPPVSIDEFLVRRNAYLDEAFSKVEPMPGAVKLVKHLQAHGVPICVATGSKRRNFEIKSKNNQVLFEPFGHDVVCGDDSRILSGKPAPDVFLVAARQLGANVLEPGQKVIEKGEDEKDSVLVFEDAKPGVEAGLNAGMNVIWVPDPNLRAVVGETDLGARQVLDSLLDFKPEEWGLPPFPQTDDA